MALKLVVAKKEDIPEGMEKLYKEDGGKWVLDVDDAVSKDRLTEFRDNNIKLMKEMEKLKADLDKFKGVDLDEYQKAMAALQKLEEQQMINDGKIDELVDKRVERMRADFEGRTNALLKQNEQLATQNATILSDLSNTLIDSKIQAAVLEVGVPRPGAMEDIKNRGHRIFKLVEGKPVPMDAQGNTIFGKDGKAPMTFEEWAQTLFENANYLFEGAAGGGGQGAGRGGGGNQGASKVIASGDPVNFGKHLADIASGKVRVAR